MPKRLLTVSWLNARRIRGQGVILAAVLWLGYAATISTPGIRDRFGHVKGADFLHAYILGSVAIQHRSSALYDVAVQREIGERLVPGSAGFYYLPVYGPQYSLLFTPLSHLPYLYAATLWMLLSAGVYAVSCYAVWRTCPNLRVHAATVAVLASAFPGFFALISFGQNSTLALGCLTGMFFALRARRNVVAGLCLGLLAYKPQLALLPACVLASACIWPGYGTCAGDGHREPARKARGTALLAILGAALALAAQFIVAAAWYGTASLLAYAHTATHLAGLASLLEPKPFLMHSLRAFWDLLLPWRGAAFALYALTASATIVLAAAFWRRPVALEHRFAIMLLATVLVAPHLTMYDLVILAPALLWIADWLQTHSAPHVAWLLYLAYVLPLAGPLARWTHLQASVLCLTALAVSFALQFRVSATERLNPAFARR